MLPKTVDDAVGALMGDIQKGDLLLVKRTKKENLPLFHDSLGRWIRNNYGLWSGNPDLKKDTGKDHPYDASMVIIEALWEKLQRT